MDKCKFYPDPKHLSPTPNIFITDAYRAGYSEALVADIVGHANKTITQHYHRGFEVGKLGDVVKLGEVVSSNQFAIKASRFVGGDI